MPSQSKYPRVKIRWIPEAGSGMDPETYNGILVADNASLYRSQDGRTALGIVEPADMAGSYRIKGADLVLLSRESLPKLAELLSGMTALQYLLSLVPRFDCPDELHV
ncbi:hypothetical protein [Paenibacillus durus]|uniref:Uncharacterized protein n=1 Tax=Paenibacillus durus TaxID=44251 RepID=A0A089HRC4_PAEDU|nr:hypothetical protein [Paenibacillus durus]AIQ13647.1 hypothetical protein PDUR_18290 [Paenibacillus durus]